MQLFGLVFGYLSIARLNISYNRYWEGATELHVLHSKWADAASQTLAFDRIDDAREDISDDFCMHIVRLFSQFSAVATAMLHLTPAEQQAMWNHLEQRLDRASTPPKTPGPGEAAVDRLQLTEIIDSEELAYLRAAPCPVLCTEHRLSRAISTRFRSRGWAPAPVSDLPGDVERHGGVPRGAEITKVAMPFAYVQFALLLLLFTCFALAIGAFMTNAAFSVATSAITASPRCSWWRTSWRTRSAPTTTTAGGREHRAFVCRCAPCCAARRHGVEGVTAAGGRRELVMDASWMGGGAMRDGTLQPRSSPGRPGRRRRRHRHDRRLDPARPPRRQQRCGRARSGAARSSGSPPPSRVARGRPGVRAAADQRRRAAARLLYGAGAGDNPVRVWLLNGTAENTFQLSPAASPRRGGRLAQAREQVEAAEADPLPPRLAAEGAAEAEADDVDMSAEDDYGIEP